MINDQLADFLTRIRNASLVHHNFVLVQNTKMNLAILNVLKTEGYIENYYLEKLTNSNRKINVILKYKGWWIKKPLISVLKLISKPGCKNFCKYKNFTNHLKFLNYNNGIAIISTSLGIMSHKKAIKLKKGGEILCYIE